MRCISPHERYSIQVIEGNEQVVVDARGYAQTITLGKPVIANFEKTGLLDYEQDAALEFFNFSGLPEGVNPLSKIGVFDTESFVESFPKDRRDELLVQIDERLRELQEKHPSEFIIVDPPAAPRPWPSYDNDSAEDVVAFQQRLEVNPEIVRLYELESQNRPEVIEAMLRQEDPEGAAVIYGPAEEEGEITVEA